MLYNQGIRKILEDHSEFEMIAVAKNISELVRGWPHNILDIILWQISGHHALPPGLKVLKEHYPLARILILADGDNQIYSGLLVNLGAHLVMSPSCSAEELCQKIVDLSRSYIPPASSNHVQDPLPKSSVLTPRECQILHLICQGFNDREIAERLNLSKRTVDGHRLKLRKKLKAPNTAMLVRVAIEEQLISINR